MERQTILLIDATYLCHRAFHATGMLSFNGEATGVAFGVLREIETLRDLFSPSVCMFAFDRGKGLRKQLYPEYKANRRKEMTEEDQEAYESLQSQIQLLGSRILPDLGYVNIRRKRGYEADDIIAAYARDVEATADVVIVSGDNDLLQCLSGNVSMYFPAKKRVVTCADFMRDWGIDPVQWASVKAIAGCTSDNIKGVRGVGEKTAARWVAGALKPTTKAYQSIMDNLEIHNQNLPLVRLPFDDLEVPELKPDAATERKLRKVRASLGIRSSSESKVSSRGVGGFDL